MPNVFASFRGRELSLLAGLAGISWAAYLAIVLSAQSLHEAGTGRHSLLILLALFGFTFACYLVAIRITLRAAETRRLLVLIVTAGTLFRVTLLFSHTIEEIDLYRYLWDGAASTQGVNPFRYAPQQVLAATDDGSLPEDLARLVRLRENSPEMTAILKRVHFGELPTIYPPASQAVFALCTWLTPPGTSVYGCMVIMKAWFLGCDLATMLLVIGLLRFTERPTGMIVIYAWCPLLIKEIANSGHVDALAFLLTTGAVCFIVRALYSPGQLRSPQWTAYCGSALLALAVGSKLYPVVLAPLLAVSLVRRHGLRFTVMPLAVFVVLTAILLSPMRPGTHSESAQSEAVIDPGQVAVLPEDAPPAAPQEVSFTPRDPSQSLRAFLGEWEMNDFLFLIVVENLRPARDVAPEIRPWFSIVPDEWRSGLVALASPLLAVEEARIPFLLARIVTASCFILIAGWLAWQGATSRTAAGWLNAAFLTIAWFWLLLPTQNPWYWCWTLPFLPFARSRAWLAVSGLAFVYYFRFWLMRYFGDTAVAGTGYGGPLFFDYVIVWLEFGPWLAWLAAGTLWRRRLPS